MESSHAEAEVGRNRKKDEADFEEDFNKDGEIGLKYSEQLKWEF